MQLRLVNVGLMRDATIEVDQFTVVMGPNNSGKSTLAAVLYAAMKAAQPFRDVYRLLYSFGAVQGEDWHPRHLNQGLHKLMGPIIDREAPMSDNTIWSTATRVSELLLKAYGQTFAAEVEAALGAPMSSLATRDPNNNQRRLPLKIQLSTPYWSLEMRLRGENTAISAKLLGGAVFPDSVKESVAEIEEINDPDFELFRIVRTWTHTLSEWLFSDFPLRAHYLPAARAGLLQSHRLVAAAMFQRSPMVGISEVSMPALSGVVADFVSEILMTEPVPRRRANEKRLLRLADKIESAVLHGSVHQSISGTGYPEISFNDEAGTYPLHRTSSMVSELAPIVLLLRQAIRPRDILIIEEPESHLHPETQATLAKLLFEASEDVSLFITTHSDFFLSQVNNEIRDLALREQQDTLPAIHAYWVDRSQEGSYLKRLDIDTWTGISEESFAHVAEALYDKQIQQQLALDGSVQDGMPDD